MSIKNLIQKEELECSVLQGNKYSKKLTGQKSLSFFVFKNLENTEIKISLNITMKEEITKRQILSKSIKEVIYDKVMFFKRR